MKKLLIFMMVCHAIVATAQTEKGQWSLVPMVGTNVIISKPLDALWGVTAGVAIRNVPATDSPSASTPAPIYNLHGQRLGTPQRGVNIVGGTKIIVR